MVDHFIAPFDDDPVVHSLDSSGLNETPPSPYHTIHTQISHSIGHLHCLESDHRREGKAVSVCLVYVAGLLMGVEYGGRL